MFSWFGGGCFSGCGGKQPKRTVKPVRTKYRTVDPTTRGRADPAECEMPFDWIRKGCSESHRRQRLQIKDATLDSLADGGYTVGSNLVKFERLRVMVAETVFVSPTLGKWPAEQLKEWADLGADFQTDNRPVQNVDGAAEVVEESPRTTVLDDAEVVKDAPTTEILSKGGNAIQVAVDLCKEGRRVAVVSAASAFHVGGGFETGGRHALEEAFCVQTTLFQSLNKAKELASAWKACEVGGKSWHMHVPLDGVILSPHVEVFRGTFEEGYGFLDNTVELEAVVSVAMPNQNEDVRDAPVDDITDYEQLVGKKMQSVFAAVACYTNADCLVLPDVGCGVFHNDPATVGNIVGRLLRAEFWGHLPLIVVLGSEEFREAVVSGSEESNFSCFYQ